MMSPRVLALIGCALVVLAGCTASPVSPGGDSPSSPGQTTLTNGDVAFESYVFDHADAGSPAIEGGIAYPLDEPSTTRFYVTVVDSPSAADRFNHSVLDPEASAFVRNTNFEESALMVIQTFPASSAPDYRVESVRRTDDGLGVRINDSSEGGTADITVETVLLRVPGETPSTVTITTEEGQTFDTTTGIVTVTPGSTPTPDAGIDRPYAADDPAENVDIPRRLQVRNDDTDTNGYHVRVVYHDRPDCRTETPACGEPARKVEIFERRGKLPAGATLTVTELAVREGTYTITASAEVSAGNGSRVTVTDSLEWTLEESSRHLLVDIDDEAVSVEEVDARAFQSSVQ